MGNGLQKLAKASGGFVTSKKLANGTTSRNYFDANGKLYLVVVSEHEISSSIRSWCKAYKNRGKVSSIFYSRGEYRIIATSRWRFQSSTPGVCQATSVNECLTQLKYMVETA